MVFRHFSRFFWSLLFFVYVSISHGFIWCIITFYLFHSIYWRLPKISNQHVLIGISQACCSLELFPLPYPYSHLLAILYVSLDFSLRFRFNCLHANSSLRPICIHKSLRRKPEPNFNYNMQLCLCQGVNRMKKKTISVRHYWLPFFSTLPTNRLRNVNYVVLRQ